MCDNLGIDDTKVTVYSVIDDFINRAIIFDNLEDVIENFKSSIENMSEGDEYECTITVSQMTRSEIDNLPEFNG